MRNPAKSNQPRGVTVAALVLVASALGLNAQLKAESLPVSDGAIVSAGAALYQRHCAECHGSDAGGGAVPNASEPTTAPGLTRLAASNAGVLPFWELYEQISGSELLPAHGTRHMPIWGVQLSVDGDEQDASLARGRIFALMAYIATLQTP